MRPGAGGLHQTCSCAGAVISCSVLRSLVCAELEPVGPQMLAEELIAGQTDVSCCFAEIYVRSWAGSWPLDEAYAMSDSHFGSCGGAPSGGEALLCAVQDVVARAQRLVDSPRPVDGYPLAWHIEASHVGDLTAIAVAAVRASGSGSAPWAR
jgi:hypothetical protein